VKLGNIGTAESSQASLLEARQTVPRENESQIRCACRVHEANGHLVVLHYSRLLLLHGP
jgi:hypothetical protein